MLSAKQLHKIIYLRQIFDNKPLWLCLGMSEFCDSAHSDFAQNWPTCTELTERHRNCKILPILCSNIDLGSTLIAATASKKHLV